MLAPPTHPGPGATTWALCAPPSIIPWGLRGKAGGLTGELLLELPDQSCCLLLLLRLLKPLPLELRWKPEVED